MAGRSAESPPDHASAAADVAGGAGMRGIGVRCDRGLAPLGRRFETSRGERSWVAGGRLGSVRLIRDRRHGERAGGARRVGVAMGRRPHELIWLTGEAGRKEPASRGGGRAFHGDRAVADGLAFHGERGRGSRAGAAIWGEFLGSRGGDLGRGRGDCGREESGARRVGRGRAWRPRSRAEREFGGR
jgi:hypothetical protein